MENILENNGFLGIKPTPTPTGNPDGSFTVALSPKNFDIFQKRQASIRNKKLFAAAAKASKVDDTAVTASVDSSRHIRHLHLDVWATFSCYFRVIFVLFRVFVLGSSLWSWGFFHFNFKNI